LNKGDSDFMQMLKRVISSVIVAFVLVNVFITVSAKEIETLDNLLVVDESGVTANNTTGEYYITIEDMKPGEIYSKNIFIQNLDPKEDYQIYLQVEPVKNEGNIVLSDITNLSLSINDTPIYKGIASGIGNVDMKNAPVSIGSFVSGKQKTMHMNIQIQGDKVKNGQYGDFIFKWVFKGVKIEKPVTGVALQTKLYITAATLSATLIVMIVLYVIVRRKRSLQMVLINDNYINNIDNKVE